MSYLTLVLNLVTFVIGIVGLCGPGHSHTAGSRAFSFALGTLPALAAGYYAVPLDQPSTGVSIAIIAILLSVLGFQRLAHSSPRSRPAHSQKMGAIK